jgi:hypothetical protein
LRQHSVHRREVFSRVGNKLRVAWMIDGFHADKTHQLRAVLVNVLDQFGLRIARAGDENGACIRDRLSDGL